MRDAIAYAQNHLYMNITEIEDDAIFGICTDMYDSITIFKDLDCNYGFTGGSHITQMVHGEVIFLPMKLQFHLTTRIRWFK